MNTSTKGAVLSALLTISGCAAADTVESAIDKADVAWMLVATTLVLFMTIPGIALFYGGMSRKKNVLSVLAQTTVICCALTLLWLVVGYSLAFAPGNAFVGGLDHAFLRGIDIKSTTGSIPTYLFVIFQMTFAVLTAALMIGSFAGRMKFSAMLVFMLLCTRPFAIGFGPRAASSLKWERLTMPEAPLLTSMRALPVWSVVW